MFNGVFHIPQPANEPVLDYAPGSPEREELRTKLNELSSTGTDVPIIIGGEEIRNGKPVNILCPHNHKNVLGTCFQGNALDVNKAIAAANEAKK